MNRKLTQQEIESSLHQYPPILTPEEAARLLQLKLSTLKKMMPEQYGFVNGIRDNNNPYTAD
jgi:hypothetical protein